MWDCEWVEEGNSEEYLEDYRGFYIVRINIGRSVITDFPAGPVTDNPPANAGDVGSTRGPGGSHLLQSDWACVQKLLSLCSGASELQ